MDKLLIVFEGSKSSSSGVKPVTDMLKTRFPFLHGQYDIYTFKPTNRNVRKAVKLIQEESYNKLVIIGKSFGCIKIKKLLEKIKWFNCIWQNANIILIDPSSWKYNGKRRTVMSINSNIKIWNIYQRSSWPRGVAINSNNGSNTLVLSDHDSIVYNKVLQIQLGAIL